MSTQRSLPPTGGARRLSRAVRPLTLALAAVLALGVACGGEGGGGGPKGKGRGGMQEGGGGPKAPGPERRVLVAADTVKTGDVADYLVTSGTLESEAQADIVPEATGVVTRIYVEEGDAVKKGQVLAVIANPSLDANAERTQLELERARIAADEARRLHASGAISDTELRDAETAFRSARATHEEAARSRGFTRVESPISGTVAVRDVRLGEVAGAARAFQVVDLARLRVVVQLPEKDLPRIREGQAVLLSGAYDEDQSADGRVQRVSPVVDATTGTVRVTIAVDPDEQALRPGQFVKARVEVDRHEGVRTMSRRALVWDDGEPIAWKIIAAAAPAPPEDADGEDKADGNEEGGFLAGLFGGEEEGENADEDDAGDPWEGIPRRGVEKARLEVGYVDTERVEIIDGLELGDQVVTAGNANLRAETLIKLEGDPDPAPKPDDDEKDGKNGKKKAKDEADGDETAAAKTAGAEDGEAADENADGAGDNGDAAEDGEQG